MDPSLRWGDKACVTIDLSDYESGASFEGDYHKALDDLQERLARIQVAHIVHKRRALIVFEGWDAAGKGGAIQRLTALWDPRAFRVWPIGAPTEEEKARHFLWRFWKKLPAAGQIAVFDRSWYGRVLVERVEELATVTDWRRGYDEINEFEAQQAYAGTTIVKLFFHVTQETQDARLKARLDHPWKRWKVTAEDFRNRARRDDYLAAVHDMFEWTNTRWAPWTVIDGNNKKAARIAALTAVADALEAACPPKPPQPDPEMERLAREAFGD
jgi:polyphosphate kinase 2 (PPK2 family)